MFNWRNRGGEYPSFEANSTIFFEEFKKFCKFCESQENLADPKPEICEVTYVNHIVPEEGEAAIELTGRVFNGLRWKAAEGFLPSPESVTFNRAYVIRNQSRQAGRLYVESSLAVRRDGSEFREFILLKLTARVNHEPDKEQNLRDSVQLAHDWVVRGFADLMDDQIQKERWGRQE